jgi:Fe2+ or Zn2+ uptake regulation protein
MPGRQHHSRGCFLTIIVDRVAGVKSPAQLTEMFRAQGLKVTPQRQSIFRALHDAEHHPTAEAVYAEVSESMPTISLRTVYQTLNDLVAMGELQQLDVGTGATRFDPNTGAHHHLVCSGCGKVRDLFVDPPSLEVPAEQAKGFTVGRAEVTWRGVCDDCSNLSSNHNKGDIQAHG